MWKSEQPTTAIEITTLDKIYWFINLWVVSQNEAICYDHKFDQDKL